MKKVTPKLHIGKMHIHKKDPLKTPKEYKLGGDNSLQNRSLKRYNHMCKCEATNLLNSNLNIPYIWLNKTIVNYGSIH